MVSLDGEYNEGLSLQSETTMFRLDRSDSAETSLDSRSEAGRERQLSAVITLDPTAWGNLPSFHSLTKRGC